MIPQVKRDVAFLGTRYDLSFGMLKVLKVQFWTAEELLKELGLLKMEQ